jgi:hypothetical protein
LRVSGKELNKLDRGTVRRFASEIGNVIVQLDPSKIPMRRSVPLHWTFRRADRDEYEDRRGLHSSAAFTLAIILLGVPARPQSVPSSQVSANDLARRVITNELNFQDDHTNWLLR